MAAASSCGDSSFYSMGEHTLKVPMELFALNCRRVAEKLRTVPEVNPTALVFLQGGLEETRNDSDVGPVFRQVDMDTCLIILCSFPKVFKPQTRTGLDTYQRSVTESGCYGAIRVCNSKGVLFIPRLPEDYAVWMGKIPGRSDFKKKYDLDAVFYVDEISTVLTQMKPDALLTLKGMNSDSGVAAKEAKFEGIAKVDNKTLFNHIAEWVIKTEMELEVLRYICQISQAHIKVMQSMRSGMMEYQAEAIFLEYCYYHGGCRHVSYTCICGSGHNGSVLHYGHAGARNDKVSGKFSPDQKMIYNSVLSAARAVMNAVQPGSGVTWRDMHLLANRAMLQELKKGGLLHGDVNGMMEVNLAGTFQPHGLRHFMGIDVHDVGGYLEGHPERPTGLGLKSPRTARGLKENIVLIVEPGCNFKYYALTDPDLSPFLVAGVLERFRGFGGVRIEEDVIITATGCEVISKVAGEVDEIEAVMAEGGES